MSETLIYLKQLKSGNWKKSNHFDYDIIRIRRIRKLVEK